MDSELAIHRWAAKKLGCSILDVQSVTFYHEDEHWYSDITYESGYDAADVLMHNGHTHRIHLDADDFGATIREILEAQDD